ncbi:MAG: hypothetical protein ACYTER_10195 [Planctomycetota bacterium]|jgi:hypothetical protein
MKRIGLIIITLIGIAILAFYDALEEDYQPHYCLALAALPTIVLFITNWIALEVRIKKRKFSWMFAGTMIINVLTLAIYVTYATNGPSDINTAAHMHVITFPILLALVCVIVSLPLLLIDFITRKKEKANL